MEIQLSRTGHVYVLRLSGRWDAFSAAAFEEQCSDLVRDEGMRHVVLDLANVDYLSSFGLRAMLNLGKLLEPLEGRLLVADLQPPVAKIYRGSGFNSLFSDFPDVQSAVKAFKVNPADA
jgi:anti-sigma B factor antagonist